MEHLPGNTVHIVFDNYTYEYNVPTKDRSTRAPRVIASIDQELPNDSESGDVFGNSNNKSQLNYLLKIIKVTIWMNVSRPCRTKLRHSKVRLCFSEGK